ncbi:MAG: hypothetical protein IMF11_03460 [Proteobacteria bacterium]|nr:hypothetical protein [Pseudomonadota bacterium]
MPRKKSSQSTHDRKVKEIANKLNKQNWDVRADVGGFVTPDGIGKKGFIPDVFATKGGKTKIIEVDTPRTVDEDQLATFRRSAAHRDSADFEHVITRPRTKKG